MLNHSKWIKTPMSIGTVCPDFRKSFTLKGRVRRATATGFVGTPHILHALSENGRADLAYDLLLQEKNPSRLFSVNNGATTVWEHWDSIREAGSFWSDDMNSFNHYAYGSVFRAFRRKLSAEATFLL